MHNEETYIYFPPMKQRYPSSTHPNVNVHQLSKFEEEEGGNEERRRRHRKEMGGGGGTEAFPDLGKHCDQEDCKQLDFLPFVCDGCQKVFCLEHRTYKAHACLNAEHNSRVVVVCDVCAASLEKKAGEEEKDILERHAESGSCDPGRKNKPRCPVKRCKEVLTFSNSSTCKTCRQKVCLKHRFPSDHACGASRAAGLPVRLPARSGIGCRDNKSGRMPTSPSVKAC